MAIRSVIDELVSVFKFETDKTSKKELTNLNVSLKGIVSTSLKVGAALSAAATGVFALDASTTKAAAKNIRLAESFGLQAEDLEALQIAIKRLGGAPSEATAALETLVTKFPNLDKPIEAMKELSAEFSGLSKKQQRIFALRFGFSDAVIQLLQEGPTKFTEELNKARLNTAFISKDQFKLIEDGSDSVIALQLAFTGLKNSLVLGTTPEFIKFNTELTKMINSLARAPLGEFISDFFGAFDDGLAKVSNVIGGINSKLSELAPAGEVFADFTKDFGSLKDAAEVLAGAITITLIPAFTALSIAASPLLAAVAAVTAAAKGFKTLKPFFTDKTKLPSAFEGFKQIFTDANPLVANLRSQNVAANIPVLNRNPERGRDIDKAFNRAPQNQISLTNNITVNGTADPSEIALNVGSATKKAISDVLNRGFVGFNRPLVG